VPPPPPPPGAFWRRPPHFIVWSVRKCSEARHRLSRAHRQLTTTSHPPLSGCSRWRAPARKGPEGREGGLAGCTRPAEPLVTGPCGAFTRGPPRGRRLRWRRDGFAKRARRRTRTWTTAPLPAARPVRRSTHAGSPADGPREVVATPYSSDDMTLPVLHTSSAFLDGTCALLLPSHRF
jgi:hypothetical protein